MKIVCTMPVRNEDWVVGLSARAVLRWVDHLVVLDHASTDRTSAILAAVADEHPGRVTVLVEGKPVWEEMRHRQRMLDTARELGATHIAMVDADEVLSGNLLGTIRGLIEQMPAIATMQLPWRCLRGSIRTVMTSGIWGGASACMAFEDGPECYWSSAHREGYDFHHRQPMGRPWIPYAPIAMLSGGLMHLQFVGARRLLAKQALYKMTEAVRWPGREPASGINARYDHAVYGAQGSRVAETPASWWAAYGNLLGHLNLCDDEAPWQELECRRLWREHGPEPFTGLDLFGVPR